LPWSSFCPRLWATRQCSICAGSGIRIGLRPLRSYICDCVYRHISRRAAWIYQLTQIYPQSRPWRVKARYDLLMHDWAADFWLCASAVDDIDVEVWKSMRMKSGKDRGKDYHALHRADAKIGRAILWRGLWPLGRYHAPHG